MYQGRHSKRSKTSSKKIVALLVALFLLITVTAGSTVAFLITSTAPVENVFIPTTLTGKIDETFENNVKSNVSVQNTGTTDAYIRAAIVVTWQNAAGDVYGKEPNLNTDYKMTLGSGWQLGDDGYYYHTNEVKAGANSGILIDECKPVAGTAPDGYTLHVEILAQGIQSKPASTVEGLWPVAVNETANTITVS